MVKRQRRQNLLFLFSLHFILLFWFGRVYELCQILCAVVLSLLAQIHIYKLAGNGCLRIGGLAVVCKECKAQIKFRNKTNQRGVAVCKTGMSYVTALVALLHCPALTVSTDCLIIKRGNRLGLEEGCVILLGDYLFAVKLAAGKVHLQPVAQICSGSHNKGRRSNCREPGEGILPIPSRFNLKAVPLGIVRDAVTKGKGGIALKGFVACGGVRHLQRSKEPLRNGIIPALACIFLNNLCRNNIHLIIVCIL